MLVTFKNVRMEINYLKCQLCFSGQRTLVNGLAHSVLEQETVKYTLSYSLIRNEWKIRKSTLNWIVIQEWKSNCETKIHSTITDQCAAVQLVWSIFVCCVGVFIYTQVVVNFHCVLQLHPVIFNTDPLTKNKSTKNIHTFRETFFYTQET